MTKEQIELRDYRDWAFEELMRAKDALDKAKKAYDSTIVEHQYRLGAYQRYKDEYNRLYQEV
jgi:uncharacterized protein YktA (UPF0223 family)